jgi:hypothetical protein
MNNSKIVDLLRTMPQQDIKLLRKWIKAHGAKKDAYRLFQYLIKNLVPAEPEKLSKEKIFRFMFRSDKYNDLKMRYMSFELLRMCEDFIVFHGITQHPSQYQLYLLQYYRKYSLPKFFEQTFSNFKDIVNKQPTRDSEYFFANMRADSEYNMYLMSKQNRAIEPSIQRLSDDLDMFYLLNKLKVIARH